MLFQLDNHIFIYQQMIEIFQQLRDPSFYIYSPFVQCYISATLELASSYFFAPFKCKAADKMCKKTCILSFSCQHKMVLRNRILFSQSHQVVLPEMGCCKTHAMFNWIALVYGLSKFMFTGGFSYKTLNIDDVEPSYHLLVKLMNAHHTNFVCNLHF